MADTDNIFNITLPINNKLVETTIEIAKKGPEISNLCGRDYDMPYPYAIIKCLSNPKLVFSVESSNDLVPNDILVEFLLFVTPRVAEMAINREYAKVGGWKFDLLTEVVKYDDSGIKHLKSIPNTNGKLSELIRKDTYFHSVKENAAGETYEQRSRLCYEDLCRFIVKIWRNPHVSGKNVVLKAFKSCNENKRIYETGEISNVLAWATGDDYLIEIKPDDINTTIAGMGRMLRRMYTSWEINGSKIRELEQKLSKDELGVLPQIVGQINLNKELDFVSDGNLRAMVERDCKEVNAAAKAGAAKSVIVLCGSIIEALLYDLLKTKESEANQTANRLVEKNKLYKKPPEELNRWAAEAMILVSHEMYPEKITKNASKLANVLRDYRNLIHPGKEDREKITFDQNIASIAISVVNLIISGLEKQILAY